MTELYKKHRPRTLKAIMGNEGTVGILRNMLERGTLPHTILLHGPSGCGKTTLARILRDELQCHRMDFREINSSSFRGIDTVRDMARMMRLAPIGPCRVYLIDECHKLTNDAQNAALKMLEDTPASVYFFLCTTEPRKLIKPLVNRCTEMPVRLLKDNELEVLLMRVMRREKIQLHEDVVDEVVQWSQGSPRTLLVLLDKVQNLPADKQKEAVVRALAEQNEAIALCRALVKRRPWVEIAAILKDLSGEPEQTRWAVLGYARVVLLRSKAPGQAYFIIRAFSEPFYDSKAAGLAAACYEAILGE